jgi:hypothetical protein
MCQDTIDYVHGGTLWFHPPVSIDTQLIVQIMGLPKEGEDSTTLFFNKSRDKALSDAMKYKFNTFKGSLDLDVTNISDDGV